MSKVIRRPNPPAHPADAQTLSFSVVDLWACEDGTDGAVRYSVLGENGLVLTEAETRFTANTSENIISAIINDIHSQFDRFILLSRLKGHGTYSIR